MNVLKIEGVCPNRYEARRGVGRISGGHAVGVGARTDPTGDARRGMLSALLGAATVLAGLTETARGWHFECRFIERVGNMDVLLPGNTIDASNGAARNIRIQFGVFDDADGPAPAGGFVGWNVGTMFVSGPVNNSDERRNNGRLAPFNFGPGPNANGNPPLPAGDPFTMLTEIDNTLGTQSPIWVCWDPDGDGVYEPTPMPQATVRGLNTFVSTFAFSIDPAPAGQTYSITAGGNLIGATEWRVIGNPTPPDCSDEPDPACPFPGSVTYAPFPTPPQAFSCTLAVVVPGPASLLTVLAGATASQRFRRRRGAESHSFSEQGA
ncbi:MAG: hypothetical protein AB7G11_00625 [Phycisphaerales bacterium]